MFVNTKNYITKRISMKKLMMCAAFVVAMGCVASAQTAPAKEKKSEKKEKKAALKDHACSDACHKAGKCVYAHGEKGHKCGKECKKTA